MYRLWNLIVKLKLNNCVFNVLKGHWNVTVVFIHQQYLGRGEKRVGHLKFCNWLNGFDWNNRNYHLNCASCSPSYAFIFTWHILMTIVSKLFYSGWLHNNCCCCCFFLSIFLAQYWIVRKLITILIFIFPLMIVYPTHEYNTLFPISLALTQLFMIFLLLLYTRYHYPRKHEY